MKVRIKQEITIVILAGHYSGFQSRAKNPLVWIFSFTSWYDVAIVSHPDECLGSVPDYSFVVTFLFSCCIELLGLVSSSTGSPRVAIPFSVSFSDLCCLCLSILVLHLPLWLLEVHTVGSFELGSFLESSRSARSVTMSLSIWKSLLLLFHVSSMNEYLVDHWKYTPQVLNVSSNELWNVATLMKK